MRIIQWLARRRFNFVDAITLGTALSMPRWSWQAAAAICIGAFVSVVLEAITDEPA